MFSKYFGKKQLRTNILIALVGGVFVIGMLTVAQKVGNWLPDLSRVLHPAKTDNVKVVPVAKISEADFPYLVPGKDADWTYDEASPAYDKAKGVVKYGVTLNNAHINVTFSQQRFPKDLQSRTSNKFKAFVNDSNPARSQDTGRGTLYFLQSIENGAPSSSGADTIIFATDDVLLFGKTGRIVGYDGWAKLLSSMHPH